MQNSSESLIYAYPEQVPIRGLFRLPVSSLVSAIFLHGLVLGAGLLFHILYGEGEAVTVPEDSVIMTVELIMETALEPEPIEEPLEEQVEKFPEIEPVEDVMDVETEDFILPLAQQDDNIVVEAKLPPKPKPRIKNVTPVRKPKPVVVERKNAPQAVAAVNDKVQKTVESKQAPQSVQKFGFIKPVYPAYLKNPTPPYPKSARRRKQEGVVLLFVRVDEKGRAVSVKIDKSSGVSALDRSALQTVRNWKFLPAKKNNIPIASDVLVPIRFELSQI